jgi:FkbM family methyltransferase
MEETIVHAKPGRSPALWRCHGRDAFGEDLTGSSSDGSQPSSETGHYIEREKELTLLHREVRRDLVARARRAAERASRRIVLRRRLPDRFGRRPIYVSPGAMLRYLHPNIEGHDDGLFAWAAEFVREGATVWDVGANCGLFAFAASTLAGPSGHVVAVEPDDFLVGLLRRSAAVHFPGAPVDVLPAAISDRLGIARLNIAERSRASNALAEVGGRSTAGGIRETYTVITVTLDWMCTHFRPPTVIKIDVEGAEVLAMRGAHDLLHRHRPVILCEIGSGQQAVSGMLADARYTMYDLGVQDRRRIEVPSYNTLAVPD